MFKKILIANRGDKQPSGCAATKSHRRQRVAHGDFTASRHV
jgi:hypothetical protein